MMGKVIMSGIVPQLVAPVTGIKLANLAEGSLVKINENGSPIEFYVAKHNYEPTLNGTGRTLLVRKDCYDKRQWHTSNVNAYASSAIDSWLNGGYKAVFDADVQSAIGTTKLYYTQGNGNNTVTTLTRAVFLLSVTELNRKPISYNVEGSVLPTTSVLKLAYYNGNVVTWWTRSPYVSNTISVNCADEGGGALGIECTSTEGSRPSFTLPATTLFDEETLLFKGVS